MTSYGLPRTHIAETIFIVPDKQDQLYCRPDYGQPMDIVACQVAFNDMPDEPGRQKLRAEGFRPGGGNRGAAAGAIGLPLVYKDSDNNPQCVITVDLDGDTSTYPLLDEEWSDYPNIKAVAAHILSTCVQGSQNSGGWGTLGLWNTWTGMLPSNANPYGRPKDAKSYVTVSVTGPKTRKKREDTDWSIALAFNAYMAGLYAKTQTDPLYRWASSLGPYVTHRFWGPHDKRWWDFNVESDALPEAKETKYDCDAKLGSPASDTCEGALIKLRGEQPPTISPGKPIIRTYRGCAISVRSDKEVTTTWDMVASVASHLIETCLAVPFGAKGGRATSTFPTAKVKQKREDFAPGLEIDIYAQPEYNGNAVDTCQAYASRHHYNVNLCPVEHHRGLLEGTTTEELSNNGTVAVVKPTNTSDVTVSLDAGHHDAFLLEYDGGEDGVTEIPDDQSPWRNEKLTAAPP